MPQQAAAGPAAPTASAAARHVKIKTISYLCRNGTHHEIRKTGDQYSFRTGGARTHRPRLRPQHAPHELRPRRALHRLGSTRGTDRPGRIRTAPLDRQPASALERPHSLHCLLPLHDRAKPPQGHRPHGIRRPAAAHLGLPGDDGPRLGSIRHHQSRKYAQSGRNRTAALLGSTAGHRRVFRGKGSNHSGSFAALVGLGMASFIATFTFTFSSPFDLASGNWLLQLALWCTLLVMLPGFILRHIARKPCSRS